MSSTSMDEDEPIVPLLYDANENYMENCDDEVNDLVLRLERLCVNDNEPMHLSFNNLSIPSSMNIVPSSTNNIEETFITDSRENVSPVFEDVISNIISADVDTKVAVGSQISLSGAETISQVLSTNPQVDIQSQDLIQEASTDGQIHTHPIDTKEEKILNTSKESKVTEANFDENPLDLSPKRNSDSKTAANLSSAVTKNKSELPSLMVAPEKVKCIDPETGEEIKHPNILQVTAGSDSRGKELGQFADDISIGIVSDPESSKLTYLADMSSDDHSNRSSGIFVDSPPDTPDIGERDAASGASKRSRKIAIVPPVSVVNESWQRHLGLFQPLSNIIGASKTNSSSDEDCKNSSSIVPPVLEVNKKIMRYLGIFQPLSNIIGASKTNSSSYEDCKNSSSIVPPVSVVNEIRQRRLGIFQPLSNIIGASKTNSSSDEDCKNLSSIREGSPIKTVIKKWRNRKKHVKPSPNPINLNHSDISEEEKPCKQKSFENMTKTTGKFRKRSISEHNSESGKRTCLEVRSRSLSSGSKNIEGASISSPTKYSIKQSRKRSNSEDNKIRAGKFRKPSTSSDDAENK